MGYPLIDETGNKYGALTVLSLTKDKNGRTAWLCQCDCGGTKIVRGPDLRKGRVTSCGCRCYSREKSINDLSGQTFGYLEVICRDDEHYDKNNKKNVYKCKCLNCGNICYIKGSDLVSGHTKSCGCKSKELNALSHIKDEVGNKYGKLTVLELVNIDNEYKWKCKCDCGNITYVPGTMLRSGNTKSCGCSSNTFSFSAQYINELLTNQKISFQREHKFQDLLGNKKPLRFDFAIFKNDKVLGCIEYNGQQHYYPIEKFGGEEQFKIQQEYDRRKVEYCSNKNIPLLILKYDLSDDEISSKVLNFIKQISKEED